MFLPFSFGNLTLDNSKTKMNKLAINLFGFVYSSSLSMLVAQNRCNVYWHYPSTLNVFPILLVHSHQSITQVFLTIHTECVAHISSISDYTILCTMTFPPLPFHLWKPIRGEISVFCLSLTGSS